MCSAFVSPNSLKNDKCHICSALVSRHGFKTTNVTCVARLFRLMAERYFLSLANWPPGGPIDSFQDELSPSDPIKSVCQDLQPPSLLLTSYSGYHWSSASRPFPVPVKIGLDPPPCEDNLTQAGCIGRVAACIKNKWNEISNNEMRFTFTEWFQNFSTNGTSRENIHETFGGLLTLYLNSHSVTGSLEFFVGQVNFVSSTLISLQCKDCNFCSCRIDVFLNTTLVRTIWNHCVDVYVMFDQNGGGRAAGELKDKSVKRSIQVVLPHKGDIVTFQNIELIWRSCCKWWSWFYKEKENKYYVNSTDLLTS